MRNTGQRYDGCVVVGLFQSLAGKWMLPILYELHHAGGPLRFGELKRAITGITTTELTKALRNFEELGLVERKAYNEVPPRVEYQCTPVGLSLRGPLCGLATWLFEHQDDLKRAKRTEPDLPTGKL